MSFLQGFIVSQFLNERGGLLAELFSDNFAGDFLVLDGIVQERRDNHLRVLALGRVGNQARHFEQGMALRQLPSFSGVYASVPPYLRCAVQLPILSLARLRRCSR